MTTSLKDMMPGVNRTIALQAQGFATIHQVQLSVGPQVTIADLGKPAVGGMPQSGGPVIG